MHDAIETEELTRAYGRHLAVDRLSLRVRRGEIYGFLGLNGAGKTTTIRMLLGMIAPDAGAARLLGEPVRSSAGDLWSRVGYLVETPHAYPQLTVRENLEIIRRLRRLARRDAVASVIERLGLADYADRPAGTLSLGNAQRLGLAKALLHEPELVVLDEPANGLDPAGVVEIRELLRGLARQSGVTVFMSSHILTEVARLATRVGIIHRGRLVEELDTGELEARRRRWVEVDARDREAAVAALVTMGLTPSRIDGMIVLDEPRAVPEPDAIAGALVERGVPPTRLAVEQEDLESYFLRLTGDDAEARP